MELVLRISGSDSFKFNMTLKSGGQHWVQSDFMYRRVPYRSFAVVTVLDLYE